MKKTCSFLLAAALAMAAMATGAMGQDLEELISQVGQEYAEAWASPFLYGFGPNQNANLYQSASVPWMGLTWGIGIKAMGTKLHDDDKTFQVVIRDVDMEEYFPNDPNVVGLTGDIVMSGPTIFGNPDVDGTVKGYSGGLEVASYDAIPGLYETSFVPLATPEGYIGGLYGAKFLIRWLPEIDAGDLGKTKYMGWGLQWSPNGLFKEPLPVDVMIGFFDQELKVGSIFKSTGTSYHLAVSKAFTLFTVYGGYAREKSNMDITYTFIDVQNNIDQDIAIETEGRQKHRWTLGGTLNIGVKLNLEMGHGDLTTYSAGLMFGM
jgi:hypothetical protein